MLVAIFWRNTCLLKSRSCLEATSKKDSGLSTEEATTAVVVPLAAYPLETAAAV